MNNNKISYNKSNLRIAPNVPNSSQQFPLITIDLTSPFNDSDDNNNNNNNNNNYNVPQISLSQNQTASKFASSQSSPSLEDTSNTISVATQNVRGINNPTKFDAVMDDFFQKDVSIFGLTETMLTSQSGDIMFKNYTTNWSSSYTH